MIKIWRSDEDDDDDTELAEEEEQEMEQITVDDVEEEEGNNCNRSGNSIMRKQLLRLKSKFENYIQQLSVFGFNSANYDLNLIKSKFFSH